MKLEKIKTRDALYIPAEIYFDKINKRYRLSLTNESRGVIYVYGLSRYVFYYNNSWYMFIADDVCGYNEYKIFVHEFIKLYKNFGNWYDAAEALMV